MSSAARATTFICPFKNYIKGFVLKSKIMAKEIITLGTKKDAKIEKTCHECGTVFTYQNNDKEYDSREQCHYIICPNNDCKAYINE